MSGAIAHFDLFNGSSTEENPPLSVSGRIFRHTCPTFNLLVWITLHILASLVTIPLFYVVPASSFLHHSKDIFLVHVVIVIDGIVLSAVVLKIILSFGAEISIRESTISTLRASLRSAAADVADQGRYQLRASAIIDRCERGDSLGERDKNDQQSHSSGAPSKLVAHAEPNWMSELDLEKAEIFPMKLKGVEQTTQEPTLQVEEEETGESSAIRILTEGEDHLNLHSTRAPGLRPSWVKDGTLCVVCHNPFGPEGAHILGTCGHVFHPPCLVDYCRVKRHCFCDVPIHARYYASVCLHESMPPAWRDNHGRSTLHGNFGWIITVDS